MYNLDPSTNDPRTRSTLGCLDKAINAVSLYNMYNMMMSKSFIETPVHLPLAHQFDYAQTYPSRSFLEPHAGSKAYR